MTTSGELHVCEYWTNAMESTEAIPIPTTHRRVREAFGSELEVAHP